MSSPTPDEPPGGAPHELDYQPPQLEGRASARSIIVEIVTVLLAVVWASEAMTTGTAWDRAPMPLTEKFAQTISAAIITALLFNLRGRHRLGCGGAFAVAAFWLVAIMWLGS